jgi:hypothetical protein
MNQHAHNCGTTGNAAGPWRRPAKEEGGDEVRLNRHLRGFSKQEVVQLEADLRQTLANAWAQKF